MGWNVYPSIKPTQHSDGNTRLRSGCKDLYFLSASGGVSPPSLTGSCGSVYRRVIFNILSERSKELLEGGLSKKKKKKNSASLFLCCILCFSRWSAFCWVSQQLSGWPYTCCTHHCLTISFERNSIVQQKTDLDMFHVPRFHKPTQTGVLQSMHLGRF